MVTDKNLNRQNYMDEFETIKKHVARHISLTNEEQEYFVSLLRIIKVRKKQSIVQPEFTCKYKSYVYNGAMRAYLSDKNANEHTIAFAIDDWWIADYNSYIFQQPATLFVEALEHTTLIQLDYNAEQLLKEAIPKFEKFFRIVTERALAFLQIRMLSILSLTAEERYEDFVNKYPQIALRVPQYALASYLGMSTEYLSKLRHNRVQKKS
jgi:CRP-like cAMP-binding protein